MFGGSTSWLVYHIEYGIQHQLSTGNKNIVRYLTILFYYSILFLLYDILEFSYALTWSSYEDESCNNEEDEPTLEHIIIEGTNKDKKTCCSWSKDEMKM